MKTVKSNVRGSLCQRKRHDFQAIPGWENMAPKRAKSAGKGRNYAMQEPATNA
jgi:hypothetical protein